MDGTPDHTRETRQAATTSMRLVSRLTSEVSLNNVRRSLALMPGRLHESIVAQLLIRRALPFFVANETLVLPRGAPLIGTIGAVARSFERSDETIRRHVRCLASQGLVTVTADGIRIDPSPDTGARVLAYLMSLHDDMAWLAAELRGWGLLPPAADGRWPSTERLLRFGLDIGLYAFERFRGPIGGWTSMTLWNALSTLSVRDVTTDAALSERFRHRSTPDEVRRATSLRGLAAATGLPYPTVRRHVLALEAAGRVAPWRGGYAVLTAQLMDEAIERRVADYVAFVLARGAALDEPDRSKSRIEASR